MNSLESVAAMQGYISNDSLDVTFTVGCDLPARPAVLASTEIS